MKIYASDWIKTVLITRTKRYLTKFWPFKSAPHTKFIILCRPRIGSTLVHTFLNSHSSVYSYGEILRKNLEKGSQTDLNAQVFRNHPAFIRAVGLKIFYEYLDIPTYRSAVLQLAGDLDIKVVHLDRKNALNEFISLQKASLSDTWSQTRIRSITDHTTYTLKVADFERFLHFQDFLRRRAEYIFAEHDIHQIYYEDLVEDQHNTLNDLQKFLDVEPKSLFSLLVKQGDSKHNDITNYDQLKAIYDEHLQNKQSRNHLNE